MNEEETQAPVAKTTDTQPTETETEQKNVAKTEDGVKSEQSTQITTPVKPDPTSKLEQPKKLADVVPTSLVWISGMVGSRQIDCAGPIELPFALTKPEWPYTMIAPNPAYTNQVFDYDAGVWVATDAKSQGQQITDLTKQVAKLNQDSVKHDQVAEQSQKMVMQQMQMLTAINTKLDKLTKDGDK